MATTKHAPPKCQECGKEMPELDYKQEGTLEFNAETGKYEMVGSDTTLYCMQCDCSVFVPDNTLPPEI